MTTSLQLPTAPSNITEVLEPIVKFRRYRAFENGAIREFYSLLRSAMLRARRAGLLQRLIIDQTLPSIMAWIPLSDWKQWRESGLREQEV
jgi:hypothetical protein